MSVVKKKKHVSKKNKKDWRKHCDIRDVEDFLEDQRLEERLGKFETKSDSELFVVDTQGGDKTEAPKTEITVKPRSAKERKRQNIEQIPKCFEILLPSSKDEVYESSRRSPRSSPERQETSPREVQDPAIKRNKLNPIGSKPTALGKISEKRRTQKGILVKKVEDARKNRKIAINKKRKAKQIRSTFNSDLWGEMTPEAKGIPSTLCDEFVPPEAQLHNVLPEKRFIPKPPPPKTVITRAAVDIPHPGISYNPSFKEHQELLQDVVQHEQKMINRQRHLMRVTTGMFKKVTQPEKEKQWQEEMSVGLPKPHNPVEDSDPETDNEYKAVNPPVKNKKKDHKARRKQKEMLQEKERLKRLKIEKKKITDLYKLRQLQSSVSKTELRQTEERSKRAAKRAETSATALPALNAHKVPVKEPDFVDPQQLSGDLRKTSATGNLLRDRYESLQRRGALAGAKLMMKKKKRVKSFFKAGHKVTDQDVERYLARGKGSK